MKRYLIACMSFNASITGGLTPNDIEFSNPKIFTCESNQSTSDVINKYRLEYRVNNTTPTIVIALSDMTDYNTGVVITTSLGKHFDYDALKHYDRFYDLGASVCIDMMLDNDVHIEPSSLLPDWLKPVAKRVSIFASKQ